MEGSVCAWRGLRRCLLAGVATTSCVVSFDDYPVGDLAPAVEISSGGAASTGGSGAGGLMAEGARSGSGTMGVGGSGAGGSGGTLGTGASGGTGIGAGGPDESGGAPAGEGGSGTEPVETSPEDLIDDFEDGNDEILHNDERSGSWLVTNDGTGIQDPSENEAQSPVLLVPARGASRRGLHTSGEGFSDWGASVLANLNEVAGDGELYDASRYTGVRFWARSGDGFEHAARVALSSRETSTFCLTCGDHFGSDFAYSETWREVRLPFDEMEQSGWGQERAALKPAELIAIQFLFIDGVEFDLFVDDVGFY